MENVFVLESKYTNCNIRLIGSHAFATENACCIIKFAMFASVEERSGKRKILTKSQTTVDAANRKDFFFCSSLHRDSLCTIARSGIDEHMNNGFSDEERFFARALWKHCSFRGGVNFPILLHLILQRRFFLVCAENKHWTEVLCRRVVFRNPATAGSCLSARHKINHTRNDGKTLWEC